MSLFKTIIHDSTTKILVWKIDETLEELETETVLKNESKIRVNEMKSEIHKKAFLCVRKLLNLENYTDFDLFYDNTGKPYLTDYKHISISHSHQFAAIIISNKIVGIDIELEREKILSIANKFTNETENKFLSTDTIKKLTTIWGAKEAVFKIVNQKGISFKEHLFVKTFKIKDKATTILVQTETINQKFDIYFDDFEGFVLVYSV